MTPTIEAHSLSRRFGDFTAVDEVDITVEPGEVVGLLGANGAGKTTTIRMLTGLLAPSGGTARLLGGPPDQGARRQLGYVPQGLGLYRDLTVAQNVEFAAAAFDIAPAPLPAPLDQIGSRPVGEIPLGLQRRLAFTVALQHRPLALVLDEPTSGVEPLAAARLWDEIRTAAEGGAGVLVSTHSMDEARRCDHLVVMAAGGVVARGTEREIVAATSAVEVTSSSWTETFRVLTDAGHLVTLAGRTVRGVGSTIGEIDRTLTDAGLEHDLTEVPATIDETMAVLDRAAKTA